MILLLCGMVALATGQVVTPETRNQATQHPPSSLKKKEEAAGVHQEKEAPATETDAMIKMDAAGYFALFANIRKEALERDRFIIPHDKQKQLDQVLEKLEERYPQSFEFHLAAYMNARNDTSMGYHLLEAYRMAPSRNDIYDDLAGFYELSANPSKKMYFCKMLEEKKVYHPALYEYANNLLQSVESKGYLFTQGEWDTYPVWIRQQLHKIRPDITILQLDLLHQEQYFNRMMAPFRLKKGAFQRFKSDKKAFFRELAKAKHGKPVYLSLTLDQSIIRANADLLYNTGLAMKLTGAPVDNLDALAGNWKKFSFTYMSIQQDNPDLNKMSGNYILPMGLLYRNALAKGKTGEAEKLKRQMMDLARMTGKLKEMEEYLKQ